MLDRFGALDVLVNNAAASLRTREVTADGFERHWATNVLGPHLLTTLLLWALRATRHGSRLPLPDSGRRAQLCALFDSDGRVSP